MDEVLKQIRFAKTQGLPFVNALTNSQSSNSEGLKKLAERVMLKGGFTGKYRVAKAVGSWRTGSGEGAAHVFHDQPDHAQLRYLASWAGMYGNSPSVLAFHGHDDGPDILHYLDFPETDISKIRAGMRNAGIIAKTMVPGPKSTRVFVYDQAGQNSALISAFGRANNAIIRQSRGTGTHIGSDAQDPDTARAKARQHYRKEITLYEAAKQANLGNPNAQLPVSGGVSASNGNGKKGGVNAGSGNRAASPGSLVRGQYYKPGTFKPSMSYGSEGKEA